MKGKVKAAWLVSIASLILLLDCSPGNNSQRNGKNERTEEQKKQTNEFISKPFLEREYRFYDLPENKVTELLGPPIKVSKRDEHFSFGATPTISTRYYYYSGLTLVYGIWSENQSSHIGVTIENYEGALRFGLHLGDPIDSFIAVLGSPDELNKAEGTYVYYYSGTSNYQENLGVELRTKNGMVKTIKYIWYKG